MNADQESLGTEAVYARRGLGRDTVVRTSIPPALGLKRGHRVRRKVPRNRMRRAPAPPTHDGRGSCEGPSIVRSDTTVATAFCWNAKTTCASAALPHQTMAMPWRSRLLIRWLATTRSTFRLL